MSLWACVCLMCVCVCACVLLCLFCVFAFSLTFCARYLFWTCWAIGKEAALPERCSLFSSFIPFLSLSPFLPLTPSLSLYLPLSAHFQLNWTISFCTCCHAPWTPARHLPICGRVKLSSAQLNATPIHTHTFTHIHTHRHTGKSLLVRPCLFWPLFNFICFAFIFVFIAVTNYVQQFDHPTPSSPFSTLLSPCCHSTLLWQFLFAIRLFHSFTAQRQWKKSNAKALKSQKATRKAATTTTATTTTITTTTTNSGSCNDSENNNKNSRRCDTSRTNSIFGGEFYSLLFASLSLCVQWAQS